MDLLECRKYSRR